MTWYISAVLNNRHRFASTLKTSDTKTDGLRVGDEGHPDIFQQRGLDNFHQLGLAVRYVDLARPLLLLATFVMIQDSTVRLLVIMPPSF